MIGLTICADNFNLKNPVRIAELGAWLLVAPHGFATEPSKLEQNSKEFQTHILTVAARTGLWVVGTNSVRGAVKGGAWKGRLHSGCSTVGRADGATAATGIFAEPDLGVIDVHE